MITVLLGKAKDVYVLNGPVNVTFPLLLMYSWLYVCPQMEIGKGVAIAPVEPSSFGPRIWDPISVSYKDEAAGGPERTFMSRGAVFEGGSAELSVKAVTEPLGPR